MINVGTELLPPEVCIILPGQAYHDQLPLDTTRSIDHFLHKPVNKADAIVKDGLRLLGLKVYTETLRSFDVSVASDMSVIPARVLSPPEVAYASGQSPNVREASWNILGMTFCKGGNMSNWAVLLVQDGRPGEFSGVGDPRLKTFLHTFTAKCQSSGIIVPDGWPTIMVTPRLPREHQDPGRRRALETVHATLASELDRGDKPSFILVLLSGEDKFIYPGTKRLCDIELGLQTVFMLLTPKKACTKNPYNLDQYLSNACLKLNVKLGGVNHLLKEDPAIQWLKSKKTMLMGIGLTSHPFSMSGNRASSIAAIVANLDDDLVHYPASIELQFGRGSGEVFIFSIPLLALR